MLVQGQNGDKENRQPTILAKIMWDKLAECTASTIDQIFTWKQTFFGPNPTSPPPSPHAMLFVRKGLPTSRPTLHRGGRGERANTAAIREMALCPTHFGQDCRIKIHGENLKVQSKGTCIVTA